MAERFEQRLADAGGRAFGVAATAAPAGCTCSSAPWASARRRGHHHPVQLRRLGQLPALRAGHAALRRHRPGHPGPGPRPGRERGQPTHGPAILPVHVFGRPSHRPRSRRIAQRTAWLLIEDACEALGRAADGRPPCGSRSARPGLRLLPEQADHHRRGRHDRHRRRRAGRDDLRSLRNQGRDKDGTWLNHVQLGYNYRLDEMSAALGVAPARAAGGAPRRPRARRRVRMARPWAASPTSPCRRRPEESVDWFVYVIRLDSDSIATR